MPPWIIGCSVLTRPSIISGNPVTDATSVTETPASDRAARIEATAPDGAARTYPIPQLNVRSISISATLPACCSAGNTSGHCQASRSMSAASGRRNMRGTFSTRPPPVMWAIPRTSPAANAAATAFA